MGGPTKLARAAVHTGDRLIGEIQARVRQIVDLLRLLPFAQGRLISVTLTGGTNTIISHKLGAPAAFFPIRQNYDGTGNRSNFAEAATAAQKGLDPRNQLAIVASTTCKVDLWFYVRASRPIESGKVQSP